MILKLIILIFGILPFVNSYLFQLAARLPLKGTPSPPGSLWPLPAQWTKRPETVVLSPNWSYQTSADCELLERAFLRYGRGLISRDKSLTQLDQTSNIIHKVIITIPNDKSINLCDEYPKLEENDPDYESYTLTILRGIPDAKVNITAKTVWGALHALETFSQLLWFDPAEEAVGTHIYYANLTEIVDYPRFPHRGLMIDSARHYLPPSLIREIIDGISYNKLNVLHWHIVDDQSFPLISKTFPELSEKGAYDTQLIYDPETVRSLIEYARDRGIRVIFEITSPGHTWVYRLSHIELLTPCYGDGINPGTPDHPNHAAHEIFDPTKNSTYEFMEKLLTEIASDVSIDPYIHLGMDEVYYACWNSSPEIGAFMEDNDFTEFSQVQSYYTKRLIDIAKSLGIRPIVWHDPLNYNVQLDTDVIVQVWKDTYVHPYNATWQEYLYTAIDGGYKSILSSCWYMNNITYGESWRKYYECNPTDLNQTLTEEQEKLIIGGEAAIWAEFVDGTNILSRLFPFLGAISERLWSPDNSSTTDDAMWRLDEHRCRMLWRGIPAQPIFNGYCGNWEVYPPLRKFEGVFNPPPSPEDNGQGKIRMAYFPFFLAIYLTLMNFA